MNSLTHSSTLGVILSHSPDGVYVKNFSSGSSVARNTGKIEIGDYLTAINSAPVTSTMDAKNLISQVVLSDFVLCRPINPFCRLGVNALYCCLL